MEKQLTIVAISDTHSSLEQIEELISKQVRGDIFIHAGDFTRYGREKHFLNFFKCLDQLQFTHKIVVAGNHDISLDQNMKPNRKEQLLSKYPCSLSRQTILQELKKRALYLQHQLIEVQGLRIFGSPYTLKYSRGAFQYQKEKDHLVWNGLPQKIDILITHSPPFGILDFTRKQCHGGSLGLLHKVQKIQPKLHIFGHIHEGHGRKKVNSTYFMNVAKKYEIYQWG